MPFAHVIVVLLAAWGLAIAQDAGDVAYLHLNRVKPGMTAQYERARKRHWLWHKRLGDTWSYQVWQIVSGDADGAYIVSSFGHTWKEVDESDQLLAGDEDPGGNVEPYLDSEPESYYRYLPNLSIAPQSFSPAPKLAVTRFLLKPEEIDNFLDGVAKIKEALRTNYSLGGAIRWFELVSGGESPQFLVLADRANWAAFDMPAGKTVEAMLEATYGRGQAAAILRTVRGAIRTQYLETWQYRRDLSFVPGGPVTSTPVPTEEEPHHHVLFKNEFVEVIRATLSPGERTLFHIHSHDTADVELVTSTTTEQLLGKPEGPPSTAHAGEVSADACTDCPMTHRVHNVGGGPMDILHVELLQRPARPSVPIDTPVAAENASARVYNWMLTPGATSSMHMHKRPYLIVAVTPLHLKMTAPDGQSFTEQVRPGDFHWVDSTVTHTLTNEGAVAGQIVEIEMK